MDEELNLDMQNEQGVAVVSFKARSISDYNGIATATEKINKFIESSPPRAVIFDFEQVKFFSSAILGLLIAVRSKLKESKGEVVISAIDPQLHRVFKITNLEKIFRFFPDKTAAKKALAES
jgi:anti-sigma B factor antagonist